MLQVHPKGFLAYSWEGTYREGLGPHAAWSFSWLNEGHTPGPSSRWTDAAAVGAHAASAQPAGLSAGFGPYVAITQKENLPVDRTGDGRVSGLVSVSASYRFGTRWLARVTWNRFATRYDRDADMVQAGIGVRF